MASLEKNRKSIYDLYCENEKGEKFIVELQHTEQIYFKDRSVYYYLEMPKFKKSIDELEARFDKCLYVLRNLERLDNIPNKFKEKIFESFFETAEVAKMNRKEFRTY